MMSINVGLTSEKKFSCIVGFSGKIIDQNDLRERIKNSTDILLIHGDIDPLVKPKNAFHSHKLIPNSKLLMIENMGHLIEEPVFNKFKDELIQHLDKNC